MKAKLNKIVDDIPPKTTEKIKLHKVKVSYCYFGFDLRKISILLKPEKNENFMILS